MGTKPRRRDGRAALAFLAPGTIGFAIFIVVPLVGSLIISLFEWPLFGTPTFIGLQNYAKLIRDHTFYTVLGNTVVFATFYTVLNLVLALAISLWLNTRVWGKSFFRVVFFLPVITPMVANALVWRLILSQDGLANATLERLGLPAVQWLSDPKLALGSIIVMSVWQSFGYNMVVLTAALGAIPREVLEASQVAGANAWQRLRYVIVPMISPALFFTSILTMIGAFQVFAQPQILTQGGPGESTNTFVLYMYRNGFSYDRLGYASALAWVLFMVVLAFTLIQFAGQRRWVNYDN
jgi:multiple sugar transport system permease protein